MNINLSLKQFSDQGCEPRKILTQAQALEAAGYKVNLQLRNWKDMELLVQQPAVQKVLPKPPHRLSLPSLIVLGALGALASIMFGWMGI